MTMHIGFTGTRHGMSGRQFSRVTREVERLATGDVVAHHGLCVGADAEFHRLMRRFDGAEIDGHPGPDGHLRAQDVLCDWVHDPAPYMARNADIVAASHVMIAAPYEDTPQPRGGTWATIKMARAALAAGKLRELIVVGRGGELLDQAAWPTRVA